MDSRWSLAVQRGLSRYGILELRNSWVPKSHSLRPLPYYALVNAMSSQRAWGDRSSPGKTRSSLAPSNPIWNMKPVPKSLMPSSSLMKTTSQSPNLTVHMILQLLINRLWANHHSRKWRPQFRYIRTTRLLIQKTAKRITHQITPWKSFAPLITYYHLLASSLEHHTQTR